MKLPDFLEVVRKTILIKANDGVDKQNINAVILVAFDQLDDQTKVDLIYSCLNDKEIDDLIQREKANDQTQELVNLNQAELIKWRSWVMRTLLIFVLVFGSLFMVLMFFSGESCEPNSPTSYIVEIKKIIDILIFNKTE